MSTCQSSSSMQNVYVASVYAFIHLDIDTYNGDFTQIRPYEAERYNNAICEYHDLNISQDFYYSYKYGGKDINRKVELRTYILRYIYHSFSQYYLVVGTGIDKVFDRSNPKDLCTEQDIVQLRKAFYLKGSEGLHYPTQRPTTCFFPDWLNEQIENITGVNPNGHFDRHFIVNVVGVKTSVNVNTTLELDLNFREAFDSENFQSLDNVIPECDRWAYGLIFGNDNYKRVPEQQVRKVISTPFSNNITESTYAGYKSIVSIRSHYHCSFEDHQYEDDLYGIDLLHADNIAAICHIMHIKRQMRRIQDMLNCSSSSEIRTALGDIAVLIGHKPTGLRELDGKFDYISRTMGINKRFANLRQMGTLIADANNIKNTNKLNTWMATLTAFTVLIGLFQLVNSQYSNNTTTMHTFDSICIQIGVLVLILLGVALCVSIIVLAIYQVKSHSKISEIRNKINSLR